MFVMERRVLFLLYISDRSRVQQLGSFNEKHATDILPIAQNIVIVSGGQGIYTLDVSDSTNPILLAEITN